MENLTEFDVYMNAMKQIDLNESAIPLYKGKVLVENADYFCKIQKLLNCDKMENSHMWLYDLDIENLDESEKNKVNNLYKLGCAKGYIEEDEEEKADSPTAECDCQEAPLGASVQDPAPVIPPKPTCAYTAMYSAVNPAGEIKTGEAYSNAISPTAAKMDIMNKLERAGYHGITILCIEVGDTCCVGNNNAECCQNVPTADIAPAELPVADVPVQADDVTVIAAEDDEEKDIDEELSLGKDAIGRTVIEKDDAEETDADEEKSDDEADKEDEDEDEDKKEEKAEEPDEKLKDDTDAEDEEKANDEESADDTEEDKKDEENPEEDKEDKKDEPSEAEKGALKDSYKKAFKAAMLKCKFEDKAFDDLTLEEKIKFFTALESAWKKADPSTFMDNKEMEALEKIVVKK